MPRFRLLQARLLDDPVRAEEHRSFATRLGVGLDQVHAHNLIDEQRTHAALLDGYDAVFVGGSGAYSVLDEDDWVKRYIELLATVADRAQPMFCSCFGFQGLVLALGGDVRKDEARGEVGTYQIALTDEGAADPVFSQLPATFDAQQGHKDSAVRLPDQVVHLARSARCEFQALKVVDKPIYATQFHPELTGTDNQARFMRYYEMYRQVFDEARADEILHSHRESPEANSLLARFVAAL